MNLKHLKAFVAVAEAGSLSAASDRLRITQPALSRQIKMLENDIGIDLFDRSGRGMQVTEAGNEFLNKVTGLLHQLEQAVDDIHSMSSELNGQVAFGMVPTVSHVLAARLAHRVALELPGVSLRIVEGYGSHLIDWLHRGEIDAMLVYGPGADLHMRVTDILYEELFLISPITGAQTELENISIRDIAELELVLPSKPHGLRTVIERAAAKKGLQLRVKFEADSFSVLKDLVKKGLGYTILPLSSLSAEEKASQFKITEIRNPKIMRQLILALPSKRVDSRAARAVLRLALNEISTMIKSGEWLAVASADLSTAI